MHIGTHTHTHTHTHTTKPYEASLHTAAQIPNTSSTQTTPHRITSHHISSHHVTALIKMVLAWQWAVASICVFLCASLAVGAGIGGGALFVGIYMIILGMDAHAAVPLSKATIFGLAIAAYSVNLWKRHPHSQQRPLIDYDTALMLEPMTLLGAIVGVLLNVLFPNWLVLLPLCLLLMVVSYRTIRKGLRLRAKEKGTPHQVLTNRRGSGDSSTHDDDDDDDDDGDDDGGDDDGGDDDDNDTDTSRNNDGNDDAVDQHTDSNGDATSMSRSRSSSSSRNRSHAAVKGPIGDHDGEDDDDDEGRTSTASSKLMSGASHGDEADDGVNGRGRTSKSPSRMERFEISDATLELEAIQRREARTVPWEKLVLLILVWLGYTTITMLLYEANDVIKPCSAGWIVLLLCAIPYVIAITYFAGRMLKRQTVRKRKCNYPFLPGDVMWEGANLNKFPALAFFAGVAAAMMGIGGGMIKSPIMLAMGLQPQVVTTTSSFMIIFTSSATTLQYLILGKLKPQQLGIVMSMGFAGAVVGQRVVNYIIAKYKKQSFLIFLLGGLTIVSGIIIVATSLATESFSKVSFNTDEICGTGNSTSSP
ncbi:hypothetical protein PTSG_01784 [Salpingoeca rosetta]|uniref:Sulfite exporter TauE/SafE n=1 Tax=Salpingoeca rosetta (strain ATCC 50818 / BSB-021) TaxID=946362 RepID=F2TYY5_SALR5|nr:uncharacterized protein PTSG_01784 [Salpingoeca rosetta]EGD78809.1 hypothetical protein PTSG_01784 [Salpingoeca rosetta]|eukprot:XP_004997765.1 hypothetical protein PTSG_01784 [Salpingoeca rosetta]